MKIVLASTSAVKLAACKKAFANVNADIFTIKAPSHVGEQPIGQETITGAFNRIGAAKRSIPDADLYISIENGLFEEDGAHIDRAVIMIHEKNGQGHTVISDGVQFPKASVEETQKRGFDQWTVGKVMQEQGLVRRHDDPHLDLSGKSRAEYIDDAMRQAVAKLGL